MSLDDLFGPQSSAEPEPAREPREPRAPREPRPPREPREPGSRSTVILAVIAGVLTIAVAVVLMIALTRGTDTTEPVTTPEATTAPPASQPASTPTASTPATTSTLTLEATGFTLQTGDGGTFTHLWADAAEPAITALTAAFGSEPTTSVESGDSRTYAYTVYSWDGFRFADVLLSEGNKPRDQVDTPTYVAVTAATIGEVGLTAEFGLEIGQSLDEVRALGPDGESSAAPPIYFFGTDRDTFFVDGARTYGVRVVTDGTRVTEIIYRFTPPDA